MKQYIYILKCSGDRLYTGYTTDIEKRLKSHLEGNISSKFTRAFKPVSIEACWMIDADKSAAMKIEASIKKLIRKEKEILIKNTDLIKNHAPENIPVATIAEWSGKDLKFKDC
jgi:putative endonuclease